MFSIKYNSYVNILNIKSTSVHKETYLVPKIKCVYYILELQKFNVYM